MADMVEKHKKAMGMHTVKVHRMTDGTPVVLRDDYMDLAVKYDRLRELHGEITGKFFKSAERLALEMGRRATLMTRYEKSIRETQDAREIAFARIMDYEMAQDQIEDMIEDMAEIRKLGDTLFGLADKVATELRYFTSNMDYQPKCLTDYEKLSVMLKEMFHVYSKETQEDRLAEDRQ